MTKPKARQQWVVGGTVAMEESVNARVERLGQMAEKRKRLHEAGDRRGLLALAEEYRTFGCGMPKTADEIRREAGRMP